MKPTAFKAKAPPTNQETKRASYHATKTAKYHNHSPYTSLAQANVTAPPHQATVPYFQSTTPPYRTTVYRTTVYRTSKPNQNHHAHVPHHRTVVKHRTTYRTIVPRLKTIPHHIPYHVPHHIPHHIPYHRTTVPHHRTVPLKLHCTMDRAYFGECCCFTALLKKKIAMSFRRNQV